MLSIVLADVPGWAWRARGLFGARLALACLSAGNLEQACAVGSEVNSLVRYTGSAVAFDELRVLARELLRWRNYPQARELRLDLTATLHRVPSARDVPCHD